MGVDPPLLPGNPYLGPESVVEVELLQFLLLRRCQCPFLQLLGFRSLNRQFLIMLRFGLDGCWFNGEFRSVSLCHSNIQLGLLGGVGGT